MNRTKIFALVLVALFVLVGADGSSCVSVTADTGTGAGGGVGAGADDFTGIDSQALNNGSLKAAALAYHLMSGIASSPGVDASIDEATFEGLVGQYAPVAEIAVDDWLATIDPSAIPTASVIPRYECTDEHQCPYKTQCFNTGPWSSAPPYECAVVGCGSSKCSACPDWFPDLLTSVAFDSWCAYVCAVRLPPRDIVAIGAVGMKKGKPFPATGAWCFNP